MEDEIRVGLDFGTHQTKICIQRKPDEGHGIPEYEFFQFIDQRGEGQYFIPSVVQINKDDTLSYGYVDPNNEKKGISMPRHEIINPVDETRIDEDAHALAGILKGKMSHVNLIPVNPVKEAGFRRPDSSKARAFKVRLENFGINVTIRRELGSDIDGACGQLRRKYR